jgi:hypothetical protein
MKDTIELLQNPDIMKQVIESEHNVDKGEVEEFDY